MNTSKFKKGLSLILTIIILFTMVPTALFALGAEEESYPVMKEYRSVTGDYHSYKTKVVTVTFLDYIDEDAYAACAPYAWDVSASSETGTVKAWMKENAEETAAAGDTRYDVFIGGNGGVAANAYSNDVFWGFEKLKEINGLENFKTGNATTMKFFFEKCYSLKSLDLSSWDVSSVESFNNMFNMAVPVNSTTVSALESINLSNWDTGSATDMAYMFNNCQSLKSLDLSSFNTKKVTTMEHMFYLCKSLTNIYIGEDWFIGPDIKTNAMFNCCYAIVGGEDIYYNEYHYGIDEKKIAVPKEEGGILTRTYKVTYEYTGVVPENAPELPALVYYPADETVLVNGSPFVEGYVFSGWSTEDAEVSGDAFVMPKNDVTLYGSFKKPVDSVEINGTEKLTLNKGEETAIIVVVKPEDATVKDIIFESDNEDVVKVENGKLTAVGAGTAIITVYSKDDETKKDTIEITVKVPATEITADKTSIELNTNETSTVKGTVNEDATNKEVTYTSSNETLFTVDENGNIKAGDKPGIGYITIKSADDSEVFVTVPVIVKRPVDEVITDKKNYEMDLGETDKIQVTVTPDDASNKDYTFTVEDETVATVAPDGTITPVGRGSTTVTVKGADGKETTVTVIVKQPANDIIIPDESKDITLDIGTNKEIGAKVDPENSDYGLVYESSNPDIAEVTEYGRVIAKNEGKVIITLKTEDGRVEETITVTVKKPVVPVEDITVDKTEIELEPGKTDKITVTVTPDAATNKEVIFKSDDETVVKVDKDGNITAVGEGTTNITITVDGKEVVVPVTVEKPFVPVEDITVDKTEIELEPGKTDKITVTVTPDAATNKEVIFKSDDETVVKVDKDGNITAVGEGTTNITITVDGKEVVVPVTVEKPFVPVEDIIVDKTEIELEPGKTDKITVTVTPDDATNKEVIFKSDDETVVKVDKDGNITAVGEGEATITITGADGKEATVTVTVKKPPVKITAPETITVVLGEEKDIEATINADTSLSYFSEDETIAKVDENGKITAVAEGETRIIVTTAGYPGLQAIIVIKVTAKPMIDTKHYMVFGKTEKIGWYSVSLDGGETFLLVFGNSHLEVEHGQEVIIKANDVFGDPFTFYINGKAAKPDENGYVRVIVDRYVLVGALGIPIEAPDAEEAMTLIQRIIKAIKDFFAMIASWFKR